MKELLELVLLTEKKMKKKNKEREREQLQVLLSNLQRISKGASRPS
jgi:hypothetical protein